MSNMRIADVPHPMSGIRPDDMVWEADKEDGHGQFQHWWHTHTCGCRAGIMGSDSEGWRVSLYKTCFVRASGAGNVKKRTIQWHARYSHRYPECAQIHHAQELARLLLAIWDKNLIAEYLDDVAERDSLVAAATEDCEQLVEHAKETLLPWREKVSRKWFDDQMKYLHLSTDHYDPVTLEGEIAEEITEGYTKKWCERIRSDVLRMMDSEFESRHEKWRQVRQTLRWRSQR